MVVTFSKSKTSKTSSKGKTRVRVVREKSTGKIIRKTYYKSSGEVQQVSYKKGGGTTAVTYKGGKATRYVQTGSKPLTGQALQDAIKAGEEYDKTGMVTRTASAGLNTMTSAGTTPPTVTSTKTSVSPARTNLEIAKHYRAYKEWQKPVDIITSTTREPYEVMGLVSGTPQVGLVDRGKQKLKGFFGFDAKSLQEEGLTRTTVSVKTDFRGARQGVRPEQVKFPMQKGGQEGYLTSKGFVEEKLPEPDPTVFDRNPYIDDTMSIAPGLITLPQREIQTTTPTSQRKANVSPQAAAEARSIKEVQGKIVAAYGKADKWVESKRPTEEEGIVSLDFAGRKIDVYRPHHQALTTVSDVFAKGVEMGRESAKYVEFETLGGKIDRATGSRRTKLGGMSLGSIGLTALSPMASMMPIPSLVPKEERSMLRKDSVQRAGIEVQQEMMSNLSTGKKAWTQYMPGTSAFKEAEYKRRVTTKLIDEGWSKTQAQYGATGLTRQRKQEAGTEFGLAIGAEVVGELVGQGLVSRALKTRKLITGSQTAFGMKQLAPSFFVAGAAEGMAQYGIYKGGQREKPTILGTLGSGAIGGAIAAPLGAKIATLPAKKGKWWMGGVYAVEPLEFAGDVIGGGITKRAGTSIPVKVVVPNFMGGGVVYGTVSPTKGKATSMAQTQPFIDITKAPVRTTTAMTTPTSSMTKAFTPSFTPAITPAMTPAITPSSLFIPSFIPTPAITTRVSTSRTPSFLPAVTGTVSSTPSFTPTFSVVPTVVEDIPFIDFPGGGGYRRRKRGRRRIPTPRARYKPSLAGLFDPKTIAKAPKFVTGVGIRRRVKKKKRGKK